MATIVKDLGAVSAYAYAVEQGYTGTEEEFAELMASYATVAQSAAASATAAAQSATAAAGSASSASGSAATATTKASEAASSASSASGSASTASAKASEAATSATNAGTSASAAAGSASTASTAATSATNAKTAAQTAQTAAETAQGKAETAQGKAEDAQSAAETAAQSVSASAAQIAQNASDISDLRDAVAVTFSASDSVDAGEYVFYSGNLYRCIVNHTGSWNAAHFEKVEVGGELERLNAGIDVLFDFHKTSLTWGDIVALIESGEMSEIFPVASQIKDTWKNTSDTSVEFPWDVVHYSANGDTWLKLHYAAPEALPFDAPEAIYYFDGTEQAGTYHIDIGTSYGTGWVTTKSIQITLTAAPAEGDQLFIDCGTNNANDPTDGRTWKVFAAGDTTAKQTGTTSNGTGGTSLGTIGNVNAHRPNGRLNAISRVVYGYARWSQSAMRQYYNSDAAAGAWWTMQNPWDRPPTQAASLRGFLNGFSEDFLNHLEETEVVTALNSQEGLSETTEKTLDKIFLPSLEQMYINPELAGEGESWDYYKELAAGAGLTGMFQRAQTYAALITYNAASTSSAVNVFLRSCGRAVASYEWIVLSSGYVDYYAAYYAYRACPSCKFKKSA